MGNPFSPTPGWDLKLALDPGVIGLPSLGLDFRFSKDGTDSDKGSHYNTFAVGWEPGVMTAADEWMMERLQCAQANLHPATLPLSIRELCKDEQDLARLVCVSFKSNGHRSTQMDMAWPLSLKGDDWFAPYSNMERMYSESDSESIYQVTMWFLNPYLTYKYLLDTCLGPLRDAVEDHTPPYHQYLDENDMPMLSNKLPTVAAIGKGMYVRYPKPDKGHGKKGHGKMGQVHDKEAKPTYVNLPKTLRWDSIKSFHITYGVPVVRERQLQEGLHVKLENQWHGVFLERMPVMSVDGKNLQPNTVMRSTFKAGIRLTRDPKTGGKGAVPPDGSIITIDFYNGDVREGRPHVGSKEKYCMGRVDNLGGKEWLEATKTDFCVLMSKPSGMRLPSNKTAFFRSDLLRARLRVKVNHTPAIRDEQAFAKFCDPKFDPELLDPLRLSLWTEPSKVPEATDLTAGPAHSRSEDNKKKYKKILRELKVKRTSNQSQDDVLMSASWMRSRIVAVQGPPGAGKTRTLRDKVIAMHKIGHKVLVVASSNVAVDTDANAVWESLSPEERKNIKCLRLETDGAEKAQRLAKLAYAQYTGEEGEADKLPEYRRPSEAQDHPAIRNGLDKICMEFATRQEYAEKALKEYDDVNKAHQAIENYDAIKRSNVAAGMTLDYRIWETTQDDMRQAEVDYQEAAHGMTEEEWRIRFQSGEISVRNFDKSRIYKESIRNYIDKAGKVTEAEKETLEAEYNIMVGRVLAQTDILFTTASNCGGALLADTDDFEPTVIFCDEAGQISVPSLCVPLTMFKKWEGVFLFGDIQQLEPTALSGQFNEFIQNAKTSPLALLSMKGFPSYLLETQYRMTPACSLFARWQFYDNKGLKDSDEVKVDNEVRQAIRKITKGLGVHGDKGKGSEYVITNVLNGCSRAVLNGTSLANYANADFIIKIINRLLKEGAVKASMIKILAYYQGQRRLLRKKIDDTAWADEIKEALEIATVESFQGMEARIVIVDTVAAKDGLSGPLLREEHTHEDEEVFGGEDFLGNEEDFGGEDFIKVGVVTRHVRSPNRLNVALTRGRDATIVVCQASLLAASYRKSRGKQYNAIANMIGDAKGRNCLLEDPTEDSHPESIKKRAEMGQMNFERERAAQRRRDLDFITKSKTNWREMRRLEAILPTGPSPIYRTRKGYTTRPIGNPKLAAEADAYDAELERAKAASLAAAEAEAEDQRTLEAGVQASLVDFPCLPPPF